MINTADDEDRGAERYPDAAMKLLNRVKFYDVAPFELEQIQV